MPVSKLTFRPGVNTQLSKTANEGGWSSSQLVRFRDGLPEKWKGWTTQVSTALVGFARCIWTWQQLDLTLNAAVGTPSRLQLSQNGGLYDITPFRVSRTLSAPFSTTAGSPIVTVTDAAHGANPGDTVLIRGASAVGGLTLAGFYVIATTALNTYTIAAAANAASTATGGGSPTIGYLIEIGPPNASVGYGVGGGPVGAGTVGTPRSATGFFALSAGQWSLSNWGQILLACPKGGSLYAWDPNGGVLSPAAIVTNATRSNGPPLVIVSMLIGMPERHAILLGTSDLNATTNFNPMQLVFSDQDDFTSYLATQVNSAGQIILQGGTRLICGLNTTAQTLIWSDICLFSARFIGGADTYGFDRLGSGCGIVGPHAMIEYGGIVYWMGANAFFYFQGGAPLELPCAVWALVFRNINASQLDKVYCGLNTSSNGILWFYPSANSQECDSYVEFNYFEQEWATGTLGRTAWVDSAVFNGPIAAGIDQMLYLHESGTDAANMPMSTSITSGFLDIGDGTDFLFIDRIIPDFVYQAGNVYVTMQTLDYPNGSPVSYGPFMCTPQTTEIPVRARGRQVSFTFATTDLGADFRLGAVRIAIAPDGRR